ncbi:MAG: hypothetical protein OCU20_10250 [Methanophagales archaeon]|nr:hypothetical protein [Methanophagales archaeon]
MARLYSGSSRPYPGRPVCHAGCSFPGEITGRGYRYPNVPAFPGKGFCLERRYEPKESRQGRRYPAPYRATCVMTGQESAEAILAQCLG